MLLLGKRGCAGEPQVRREGGVRVGVPAPKPPTGWLFSEQIHLGSPQKPQPPPAQITGCSRGLVRVTLAGPVWSKVGRLSKNALLGTQLRMLP